MSERIELPRGCMGIQPASVRGPCAAGIDIRPGSWDIVVADLRRSPAQVPVVRPIFVGKVRDEADVLFLLRQYKVRIAVADTRPEMTLAKRLQVSAEPYGIQVWRAEYNTAPSAIEMQSNDKEMVLKMDRTMTIDVVHFSFLTGLTVVLPQNYKEITGGQFAREMTSSQRVPTRWQGKDCYAWEHQGPDHSLHAFNYLLSAIRKGNLISYGGAETMGAERGLVDGTFGKNLKRRRGDDDDEQDADGRVIFEA